MNLTVWKKRWGCQIYDILAVVPKWGSELKTA